MLRESRKAYSRKKLIVIIQEALNRKKVEGFFSASITEILFITLNRKKLRVF